MKALLLIWMFLLAWPCLSFSQDDFNRIDENYKQFRATFEQEITTLSPGDSSLSEPVTRVLLPCWLFDAMEGNHVQFMTVGISDPLTDSTACRSQAKERAMYLSSLMYNSSVTGLVDHFYQEYESDKQGTGGQYIDYLELDSEIGPGPNKFETVREEFLPSGELVMLIQCPGEKNNPPAVFYKTSSLVKEFGQGSKYELNMRVELTRRFKGMNDYKPVFVSRTVNQVTGFDSGSPEALPEAEDRRYHYHLPPGCAQEEFEQGPGAEKGLWNALLNSVIRELSIAIRSQPGKVMSASDSYSDKIQVLNREALNGTMSFRISRLQFHDNRLRAVLDQLKFSQP